MLAREFEFGVFGDHVAGCLGRNAEKRGGARSRGEAWHVQDQDEDEDEE
jgi:hypothetical protein